MKKKLISFVLIISCLLIFVGCSSSDGVWDSADLTKAGEAASDVDIEDTTLQKPAFQMGNYVFYLGDFTIQDLLNSGAKDSGDNELEENDYGEYGGDVGEIVTLVLEYNDYNFTVIAENETEDYCLINGYTVTDIYFANDYFAVSGGLSVSNSLDEFVVVWGEPLETISGGDVLESYEGITAYYFVNKFADEVACVFIDDDTEYALSIRISEAVNYIDETAITSDLIYSWIDEYLEDFAGSSVIYELDTSTTGVVADLEWCSATFYELNEEKIDLDTYGANEISLTDQTPNTLIVIEYKTTVSYSKETIADIAISDGITLENEYEVYGCFFIIDVTEDEDGNIISAVTSTLLHSTNMFYLSEDNMLEHVFYASSRGYDIDKYSVQNIEL